jgi:hypothetical protein
MLHQIVTFVTHFFGAVLFVFYLFAIFDVLRKGSKRPFYHLVFLELKSYLFAIVAMLSLATIVGSIYLFSKLNLAFVVSIALGIPIGTIFTILGYHFLKEKFPQF